MRTATRPLILLTCIVLVASACGPGGNPASAAEVNGESIPVSVVESRYDTVATNPQFADQLGNDPDGTLTAQVQAQILTELIQAELWEQGAADLGIEITEADVDARRDDLIEEVGGQDAFDDLVEQSGLTEDDLQREIRNIAVRERVEEQLTADLEVSDDEVEEFYEENREQRYELVEARHILTETQAEADAVLERLDDGEDFGEIAQEVSVDPGSGERGGDLGEFGRGQMVPEFEQAAFDAEIGEVVGPVESQFGFHVIEVTGRVEQELAEVEDDIRAELRQGREGAAVQEWLSSLLAEAEVTVNPRFGEWNAASGEVVPADTLEEVEVELEPGAEPELPEDPDGEDLELDLDE